MKLWLDPCQSKQRSEVLKLSSGSTPVDESNVFGCSEEFKRRGPGGHLRASIHKSIESDEEMNELREEVQNEAWEL